MRRFPSYPANPHAASGQARIKINAKHYYLGKHNSPESHKKYTALYDQHQGGALPAVSQRLTVAELCTRFLAGAEKSKREVVHFRLALRIVNQSIGERAVEFITAASLGDARQAMIAAGWSRGYIQAQVMRARSVFRWGEAHGLAPRGTWETLRTLAPMPKGVRQTARREGVEWPTIQAVLPFVPAAVQAMIQVQFWAGLRPSEVCRMRVCDVVQDGADWLYWLAGHKNDWRPGREREAAVLGAEAMKALLPWLEAARARGEDAYLFPTMRPKRSGCYTVEGYDRALCRAFQAHPELTKFVCYQLRHGAKRRITRELGLDAARAALRQSSLQTTDRYDGAQDLELARRVARKTG